MSGRGDSPPKGGLFGLGWPLARLGRTLDRATSGSLYDKTPDSLRAVPPFLPSEPTERGRLIVAGHWHWNGERMICRIDEFPFTQRAPSDMFHDWLHSFAWLGEAAASCGTDRQSTRMLRDFVDAWNAGHARYDVDTWRPDLIARRAMAWFNYADVLFGGDSSGRVGRLESLGRQARRLDLNLPKLEPGLARLHAAIGLAAMGAALPGADRMLESGLAIVNEELLAQVLTDGGHIDRRPETLVDLMTLLRQLKGMMGRINRPAPPAMQRALDRMGPMLHYLTHADGRLAAFHGGGRGDQARMKFALADHPPPPRLFRIAPQTGFQRIETPGATLLMDSLAPPDTVEGHASPLAFELVSANGPIFVNCGWWRGGPHQLRTALRATAAHNALVVDNTNAMPLWIEDPKGGGRYRRPVAGATARRTEEDAGVWLDASHDGYRVAHGLVHRRRLFMTREGNDLRGEDTLFAPLDTRELQTSQPFDIRFHLHPDARITLSDDRRGALITLKGGEQWRFRTDLDPVALEDSLSLAEGVEPRRTTQIVLSGQTRPDLPPEHAPNRVRWTLKRV